MAGESSEKEVADVHVQMWTHYDNLRQKKNSTFLTANSILAVIASFSVKVKDSPRPVWAISLVGITIAIAWFLLLTRNASYIAYHRTRVGEDWTPKSWTPRSTTLDRTLPVAFFFFWMVFLVYSFF